MVMTSSRQIWAFARDKGTIYFLEEPYQTADIVLGLPFHHFLAKVESDGLPRNSVWVTLGFTALLSLASHHLYLMHQALD